MLQIIAGIDTISNNSSNFSELADTPGVSKGSASNVVSDTISLIQEIFCLVASPPLLPCNRPAPLPLPLCDSLVSLLLGWLFN